MESTKTAGRKAVIFAAAFMALALAGCRDTEKNAEAVKEGAGSQAGGQPEAETVNTGWEPQPELAGRPEAEPETESHPATGSQQGQDIGGTEPEEGETLPGQPDGPVKAAEKKTPPEGWELTLASEDWGLSFTEPGTAPKGNATAKDLAWYDGYYVGDGSEKVIYLTFDCGYENGNTEPILDALKKHNVKATFFVVGHFLETAPDFVKRMVQEGHAVGNHTYHHPDMASISDKGDFQKEMDGVADLFREITGEELSPYYRPPQGKCNVHNLQMAQELGYYTIFWSLAYVDWDQDRQPGHGEAFDKLTTRVHPGAVVLLHNTSSTNGEILDELLTKWEGMGYTFKPLSELVAGG
ncbi:peptidoglycan-N-acetylmuramic acid deacetylase PdaA [Lachnospiraceae bacterium]|nr:peptidoglycan-N-acetylmuramic acid deacetylase PdaA [Lachnospiraceae bacterium]